jgi:hypothetical protein
VGEEEGVRRGWAGAWGRGVGGAVAARMEGGGGGKEEGGGGAGV